MTQQEQAKAVEQAMCDHSERIPGTGKETCAICGAEFPHSSGVAIGRAASASSSKCLAIGVGATVRSGGTSIGYGVGGKAPGEVLLKSRVAWYRRIWRLFTFVYNYLVYGDIRL